MLQGKRYIISGVSRLAVRAARALAASHAEVTVVRMSGEGDRLIGLFGEGITLLDTDAEDVAQTLRAAGIETAACLLALADEDLDNLRAAVAAREAAPDVPVVLRAFDPALADQLESGLNVRRAYSVSALAAPAFVAAACGDDVLETLRLGDGVIPVCRVTLRPGSPLVGLGSDLVKERFHCVVLAWTAGEGVWQAASDTGEPLVAGQQILVGGLLQDVLRMCARNAGWLREGKRRRLRFTRRLPRPAHRPKRITLLPLVAASLVALLIVSVAVFSATLHLRLVDSIYFVITTATTTGYGDISLKDAPDWLKLFGNLIMLSGGALLGILFSYLAAIATAERLEETMGRRAAQMSGHVVVAGLGNVGYRIARHLSDLGMEVSALELSPGARFVEALRARAPVLSGDARLPENLERVSVAHAAAFIACTDDDLVNIQACLHARRLNPKIITVARIFDDALADRLSDAFQITRALSASQAAAGAFLGAATDESAVRSVRVGDLDFLACRYRAATEVPAATTACWRVSGVRVLAAHPLGGVLHSPAVLRGLAPGDEVILCGPAEAIRDIVAPHTPRNQTPISVSQTIRAK